VPAFSKAVVSFDAAEFAALTDVNPLELLPAPGAGKYIAVRNLDCIMLKATYAWGPRASVVLALGSETTLLSMLSIVLIGGLNDANESTVGVGNANSSTSQSWSFGAAEGENQPLTVALQDGDSMLGGPVLAASVAAGGSGYAPGDTGTINDPPDGFGFGATYVVDAVDGGGGVTAFTVTTAGSGYGVGVTTTTHTTGSGDDAFTVDVTSVGVGDSPVKFVIYYTVEDL
jgi:hypothetical protein